MIDLIRHNQPAIAAICQQFGVRRLEVFGSAATGAFTPGTSDIDFVVDLGGTNRVSPGGLFGSLTHSGNSWGVGLTS